MHYKLQSRQPIVVLVRGKTSVPLSVDRNCHLPTTDETGMHTSVGMLPVNRLTDYPVLEA